MLAAETKRPALHTTHLALPLLEIEPVGITLDAPLGDAAALGDEDSVGDCVGDTLADCDGLKLPETETVPLTVEERVALASADTDALADTLQRDDGERATRRRW